MRKFLMTTTCAIAIVLGGCNVVTPPAAAESGSKSTIGILLGAALGGLGGSQIGGGSGQLIATGVGVLLGAIVGNEIGISMDKVDRTYATKAAQSSFEHSKNGNPTTWNNPDTGNYGSTTPVKTYQVASGRYCREFQTEVTVNGKTERAYGTACRRVDGSWELMN